MKQLLQKRILLPILALLCFTASRAQNNIQIDLRNVLLSGDGYSATFEFWVTALQTYTGNTAGWDSLLYRADVSVGTYNILGADIAPTSAVDQSATAYITNPGAPPVGNSKFGITFTRLESEPDLVISKPVEFGVVTLHFNYPVKSGVGKIISRSQPTYPAAQSTYYTNNTKSEYAANTFTNSILPISIVSFTGVKTMNGNQLTWTIANAVNFNHFNLQRRADGANFTTLAQITPNTIGNYNYTDATAKGTEFYRLEAVDNDGSIQYSSTVAIVDNISRFTVASVYPVPATTVLNVAVYAPTTTNITFTIVNTEGKIVEREIHSIVGGVTQSIDLSKIAHGTYLLSVNAEGAEHTSKFIKM